MFVENVSWRESADVVVVGFGGAGAVAAIAAHDLGASVLVVEKQEAGHLCTSTQMSAGVFICPNDPEEAVRYMEGLCQVDAGLAWTDRDSLRVWAHYAFQNKAWLEQLGAHLKPFIRGGEHRHIPGHEAIESFQVAGCGLGLHRLLVAQIVKRGIPVRYNTPARKLLVDRDGTVVGVRVAQAENRQLVDMRARCAVILATGGFEFDETLKLNYLRVYPTYFMGTPAASGDGVRLAMDVGANLWHMNCCSARLVAKFPDFPIAFGLRFAGRQRLRSDTVGGEEDGRRPPGFIIVDRDGRRFTSENLKMHSLYYELTVYDSQRLRYLRVPSYWIFDRRRMEDSPLPQRLSGPAGPVQLYHWSHDNQAELARGWITQGDTVTALAEKLGLPAGNLEATVERFNAYCAQGADPEFQRRPADLVPLDQPPFYGVTLYPGGPNTQGGPRHNHRAQVLGVDGAPIPHLYAIGELGSIFGMLYPAAGGNLSECIAFGRVAAEHAVREMPIMVAAPG